MSDMSSDVRVKRLIRKYGVEGYGLYTYILERIVNKLETESPLPDLEETAGDIAGDLKMDTLRVEEIMLYAMEQGLFTQDDVTGRLVAHKVYKYLQQSETRSKQIRSMIDAYKDNNQLALDCLRQNGTVTENCEEQNRTEQNTTEEKKAADAIIDYLNAKAEKRYHHTPANRRPISARLSEGFTDDDCRTVIDNQVAVWKDDGKMNEYLRPATLFAPSKFEGYLNAKRKPKAGGEMVDNGDGTWDYKDVL